MSRRKSVPSKLRQEILERDGQRCVKCNRSTDLDVHHVHAVGDGGTDEPENLVTLCKTCHLEWHVFERVCTIPFQEWVTYPPVHQLIIALRAPIPEGISAQEYREAILTASSIHNSLRAN